MALQPFPLVSVEVGKPKDQTHVLSVSLVHKAKVAELVKVSDLNLFHQLKIIDKDTWVGALPEDTEPGNYVSKQDPMLIIKYKPVFFHVVVEILVTCLNPHCFVSHEPMRFLLWQVFEPLEWSLENVTVKCLSTPPLSYHISGHTKI